MGSGAVVAGWSRIVLPWYSRAGAAQPVDVRRAPVADTGNGQTNLPCADLNLTPGGPYGAGSSGIDASIQGGSDEPKVQSSLS